MLTREIAKTLYKISDFLDWQKSGRLVLSPYFQRRQVWSPGAKSFLIDTIIKGLPIPIIFLRDQKTDLRKLEHKREVVDGQQRIRAVISFISPSSLPDYNPARDFFQIKRAHSKDYGDKDFSQLPSDIQQWILEYEFNVHVLPSSVDDREIIQIFARMNSTGYKLNPQELRNAAYFGEFKTSVFALAAEQLHRWRDWGIFTEDNIARMQEVEMTSQFSQLMLNGITGGTSGSLDRLYKAKDKDDDYPERAVVERRFRYIMDLIDDELGGEIRQSTFRKRAPFYGLFAVVYDAAYGINSKLRKVKPTSLPKEFSEHLREASNRIQTQKAPQRVLEALSRRTTHPESRRTVVAYLRKCCALG